MVRRLSISALYCAVMRLLTPSGVLQLEAQACTGVQAAAHVGFQRGELALLPSAVAAEAVAAGSACRQLGLQRLPRAHRKDLWLGVEQHAAALRVTKSMICLRSLCSPRSGRSC
jgi:hypothetical protein